MLRNKKQSKSKSERNSENKRKSENKNRSESKSENSALSVSECGNESDSPSHEMDSANQFGNSTIVQVLIHMCFDRIKDPRSVEEGKT